MRSKVSRNFVLLAPPSCGEVSANKSANVGALIFIVTLFVSVLIIAYHPPFVQRFLNANLEAPCGAKVKPFIDLTIAPNFGDKKVTNKVGLVTTGTLDSFDARITNNAMYKGKVGVETTKGKHSFGLNYGIGGGNRGRVDQTLQANYRYQF